MFQLTMCAGIVECSCYIFELIRSINSQWKFLDCSTTAFCERNESSVLFAISKDLKISSKRRYTSPGLT
jgi:hypothetical protein